MKFLEFTLERPVKLFPVMGMTEVTIETTGEVDVINCKPTVHGGPRKVVLASTERGELTRSPMGMNRTVRVTLPTSCATPAEFKRQVELLFDEYLVNMV